jgi:hypothetical protein
MPSRENQPAGALQGGRYDQFKQTAGRTIDLLAEDCRRYVFEVVGNATTMQNGLSSAVVRTGARRRLAGVGHGRTGRQARECLNKPPPHASAN